MIKALTVSLADSLHRLQVLHHMNAIIQGSAKDQHQMSQELQNPEWLSVIDKAVSSIVEVTAPACTYRLWTPLLVPAISSKMDAEVPQWKGSALLMRLQRTLPTTGEKRLSHAEMQHGTELMSKVRIWMTSVPSSQMHVIDGVIKHAVC